MLLYCWDKQTRMWLQKDKQIIGNIGAKLLSKVTLAMERKV